MYNWLMDTISKIKWHRAREIFFGYKHAVKNDNKEFSNLCSLLSENFDAIILTEDRGSLSSWGVKLLHFILTGKKSKYTHALLKIDDVYIEAVNSGVRYSSFDEITKCDSIAILTPKYSNVNWIGSVTAAKWELDVLGKDYDKKFNLLDRKDMSCIEVVYDRLKQSGDLVAMPNLIELINKRKNLTPHMVYECNDFNKIHEIRR